MKKEFKVWRVRAFLTTVVASAVLAGVWWNERRVDPVVEGKRLSEWLRRAEVPSNSMLDFTIPPDPAAEKVIQSVGADAVPLLLRLLSEDECSWVFRSKQWLHWRMRWEPIDVESKRMLAQRGFSLIGTDGQEATKRLLELADHKCTEEVAVRCLVSTGSAEGKAKILALLTESDPDRRKLGLSGVDERPDQATLQRLLAIVREDPKQDVRIHVLYVLLRVEDGSLIVPALMDLFRKEPDADIRGRCLWTLGHHWRHRDKLQTFLEEVSEQGATAQERQIAQWGLGNMDAAEKEHRAWNPK